jgi:hypothetical protein
MANTIALKGGFIRKEGEASAAITPGHLVEFGGANDLRVHSTSGGPARKAFALENDLIGDAIGDAYAAGATVQYGVFESGAEINAFLDGGENASKGDALVSAGDGSLRVQSTEVEQDVIVAYAMEAKDNSAQSAGGTQLRIIVEAA